MKAISELQQEIRNIRRDLSKMDERLANIDAELLMFKDSVQNNSNFDHIYNLAEAMPIIRHPVISFPQQEKSIYFGILLMIATLENSIADPQLLFLQRMIMADPHRKRIDYYMGNLGKIQPDNVIFHLSDKAIIAHGDNLLLDAMLVAKLGTSCTVTTLAIISDIASILGKTKQELRYICTAAAALLTQDRHHIPSGVSMTLHMDDVFGYYLRELSGWNERVERKSKQAAYRDAGEVFDKAIEEITKKPLTLPTGKMIGGAVGYIAGMATKQAQKRAEKDRKKAQQLAVQEALQNPIMQLIQVLSVIAEQKKQSEMSK